MEIGDRVLVMPSFGENVAVSLGGLSEGDKVILYNLKDETRIAVPTLSLSIGDPVFSSPSFDFAGFNWKMDFDFNLIPLIIPIIWINIPLKLWQGGSLYSMEYLTVDFPQTGDYYFHVGGSSVADVFLRPTGDHVADVFINYTGLSIPSNHSKVYYKDKCISWNQPGYYSPANEGKKVGTVNFWSGEISYSYDPCS